MNKRIYKRICLPLFCIASIFILLPACKKEKLNAPVITGVRNYAPAPGDSIVHSVIPGQWVVLLGHNLRNGVQIAFDGIPANFNWAR